MWVLNPWMINNYNYFYDELQLSSRTSAVDEQQLKWYVLESHAARLVCPNSDDATRLANDDARRTLTWLRAKSDALWCSGSAECLGTDCRSSDCSTTNWWVAHGTVVRWVPGLPQSGLDLGKPKPVMRCMGMLYPCFPYLLPTFLASSDYLQKERSQVCLLPYLHELIKDSQKQTH